MVPQRVQIHMHRKLFYGVASVRHGIAGYRVANRLLVTSCQHVNHYQASGSFCVASHTDNLHRHFQVNRLENTQITLPTNAHLANSLARRSLPDSQNQNGNDHSKRSQDRLPANRQRPMPVLSQSATEHADCTEPHPPQS